MIGPSFLNRGKSAILYSGACMKKTIICLVTIALSCLFVFGLGTYLRNDVNVFSDHETKYTKVQVTAIKTGEVSASSSADSSLDARMLPIAYSLISSVLFNSFFIQYNISPQAR